MKYLHIGELAARTGVSPKALRLYEARGLLRPDARSDAGYRLYGANALARLNEIGVLKRAGFTLAEIGKLLARTGSAAALIEARIVALRVEVRAKEQALAALEHAWRGLDSTSSDIGQLLEDIKVNENLDVRFTAAERAAFKRRSDLLTRHLSDAERAKLRARATAYGEAKLERINKEWADLIAKVHAAMEAGTPASDPNVVALGRRWFELVQASTGGDDALGVKLKAAWELEPEAMASAGLSHAMFRYVGEAWRTAGLLTLSR